MSIHLLNIGTSALHATQQALSTTGHNIANVNTEGYSRQRAEMETLQPQTNRGSYIGSGVNVANIARSHSDFIEAEILHLGASASQSQVFYDLSTRIDDLLIDSENGLTSTMENFFASMQNVANNPTSLPERQVLLGDAQALQARQNSLYDSVAKLNLEVNERMQLTVGEINSMADSMVQLNQRITAATIGGHSPNDLLDQRDALLREMSSKVDLTLSEQSDGSVNVFIGQGYGLVVGGQVHHLKTVGGAYDGAQLDIGLEGLPDSININNSIAGGELQGLMDFRTQMLDPALGRLGLLSVGLSETVNNQQQLGVDLDGNLGSAMFASPSLSATANNSNAGSATPAVSLTDVSQLTAGNYSLAYSAGTWQLTREADGTTVSGPGPLAMDGFSVDLSAGVPGNGDSFLIQPARAGGAQFSLAITDPRAIAAAAPLYADATLSNAGSLSIAELQVSDSVDLPLAAPINMTFNPDALGPGIPGFDVSGGVTTTVAYDPSVDAGGASFSLGLTGISFTVSGVPLAGDSVTLNNTGPGSGDNRNALALAGLSSTGSLEGGNSTFHDVYSGMISNVAITTAQAETGSAVENAMLAQVVNSQTAISGVNLDEEAANLLRFQQQYQAAAQLIATADLVFSTLLNVTARR